MVWGTSYSKGEQRMRCTSVFTPNSPERKESVNGRENAGLSGWAMCIAEEERKGLAPSAVRCCLQTFQWSDRLTVWLAYGGRTCGTFLLLNNSAPQRYVTPNTTHTHMHTEVHVRCSFGFICLSLMFLNLILTG